MQRRNFLGHALAGGFVGTSQLPAQTPAPATNVVIERATAGTPHRGKVLAVITPHLDDGPFFACGTVVKLLQEGYTGYFIRTSNDEKDSYKLSLGETVLGNEIVDGMAGAATVLLTCWPEPLPPASGPARSRIVVWARSNRPCAIRLSSRLLVVAWEEEHGQGRYI